MLGARVLAMNIGFSRCTVLAILCFATLGANVAVAQDPGEADRRTALQSLLGTMEGGQRAPVQESARVRTVEGGFIRFLGAAPGAHFRVSQSAGGDPVIQATAFLDQWRSLLGDDSVSLAYPLLRSKSLGDSTALRFDQIYDGIPVYAAQILVQVDSSGGVRSVMSDVSRRTGVIDAGEVSTDPTVSVNAAGNVATAWMVAEFGAYFYEASAQELVIYDPDVVGATGPLRLAWSMRSIRRRYEKWCWSMLTMARSRFTIRSFMTR